MVKNTLTEIAADRAGADALKEVLEGPTAFTFVRADGDVALAAKALAQFKREHDVLELQGRRDERRDAVGRPARWRCRACPAREVLHAQLVGVIASPITGLVRTLNALIAGLAIQLQQIVEQGLLPAGEAPAAEEPAAEAEAPAEETRQPRRRQPRRSPPKRRPPRQPEETPTVRSRPKPAASAGN